MSDETADVQPGDEHDLSRRALIKRAAIVGGVVAWTAPTIQVLGQGTAWAKAKKIVPGTVVAGCGSGQTKPNRFVYEWVGGSCTGLNGCAAGKCVCNNYADCGTGDVTIVMTGTTLVAGSGTDGANILNSTTVTGPIGMGFTVVKASNNQFFTIYTGYNSTTTKCQEVQFHVSCSATPPVQPGFQLGGLLLFDWGYVP
jgi:hypothetical protein